MKNKLTLEQKDLIFGTLLGDANLQSFTKGKTWRYRAIHKAEHFEYILHKYEILKPYINMELIFSKIYDIRTFKYYERYYFNTLTDKSFRFFANLFYKWENNKFIKVIPKNIEKFLTAKAIAYWYMDDGSLKWLGKYNAMRICTDNFDLTSIKRLQKALKQKFNIITSIIKKKKNNVILGYILSINEKNSLDFIKLIEPYLIKCMRYKVADGNKYNL
jgi:hypothetical protein